MSTLRAAQAALVALLAGCAGAPDCLEPGDICTVVGTGAAGFNGDGNPPLESDLYRPISVTFDAAGAMYFLDWNNHRLRVIDGDGLVQTAVGSLIPGDGPQDGREEGDGAPGHEVPMNHPTDLAWAGDQLLLAVWHNHKIRAYDPASHLVTIVAGSEPGFAGDGEDAATALLEYPGAVEVDPEGRIWVVDNDNGRLRVIEDGVIQTVVGSGTLGFNGDGRPLLETDLGLPPGRGEGFEPGGGIAIDDDGIVWLAESLTHRVRRIDVVAGDITTIAGTGEPGWDGDGAGAAVDYPHDVAIGPDGGLWFSDSHNHRVRRVVDGEVETMVGSGEEDFAGDGGPALEAAMGRPAGLAFDAEGHLYIADQDNHRIRKVLRTW